jgi:hypothetical protein
MDLNLNRTAVGLALASTRFLPQTLKFPAPLFDIVNEIRASGGFSFCLDCERFARVKAAENRHFVVRGLFRGFRKTKSAASRFSRRR